MTRRRLIMLGCLSLLLGAGVNVVVAWLYANKPFETMRWFPNSEVVTDRGWRSRVMRGSAREEIVSSYLIGWSDETPRWRAPPWCIASEEADAGHAFEPWAMGMATIRWTDVAAGWPMGSMAYRVKRGTYQGSGRILIKDTVIAGHELVWGDRGIVLPFRVIVRGFIVNTLLYALVAFALLAGVASAWRALVRRSRIRHGRCPMCGYDLSGGPPGPCPECGVRRRVRPAETANANPRRPGNNCPCPAPGGPRRPARRRP